MNKVNLAEKFALIDDHWNPRIAAELNGQHVKLVKLSGEFVWHQHATEDELFLVIRGQLTIELRDSRIELSAGEFVVIPRGVEHRPVAFEETHVLLLEPTTTLNTGDADDPRTINRPAWI